MRTKLLSALLLASTALAGVASADGIVRDHRYDRDQRYDRRDVDNRSTYRQPRWTWSGGVQVTSQPSWMPQVNYGYQVDADGDEVQPYGYGHDPYVEGIARGEWYPIGRNMRFAQMQLSELDFNMGGRPLQSLEVKSYSGKSFVSAVHVQLNDGRELKLPISRNLDATHAPNVRVDLGPDAQRIGIRKIELFGWSTVDGAFNVIAA